MTAVASHALVLGWIALSLYSELYPGVKQEGTDQEQGARRGGEKTAMYAKQTGKQELKVPSDWSYNKSVLLMV